MKNIMSYRLMQNLQKIFSYTIDSKKIVSPYNKSIEHNIYYFEQQYPETIKQMINYANEYDIKIVLIKQAIYIDPEIQKIIKNKNLSELINLLKTVRANSEFRMNYEDIFGF